MYIILLSINPFAAKPKLFEVIRIAITLLSISIIPFNTGKSKQFLVSKLPRITIQWITTCQKIILSFKVIIDTP